MIARILLAACVLLGARGTALAQEGRVEFHVGVGRFGGGGVGSRDAALVTADGSPFRLFSTDTEWAGSTFVAAGLAFRLTRLIDVEARGTYGHPSLVTRVTDDAEGAPPISASERLQEYSVAAVAVLHPERWRLWRRVRFFASGGAGYLRHLHDGESFAESGRLYLAGGGLKVRLGSGRGVLKATGLRVDAGMAVRDGPPSPGGGATASPVVGAALFVRF